MEGGLRLGFQHVLVSSLLFFLPALGLGYGLEAGLGILPTITQKSTNLIAITRI